MGDNQKSHTWTVHSDDKTFWILVTGFWSARALGRASTSEFIRRQGQLRHRHPLPLHIPFGRPPGTHSPVQVRLRIRAIEHDTSRKTVEDESCQDYQLAGSSTAIPMSVHPPPVWGCHDPVFQGSKERHDQIWYRQCACPVHHG
jgi:hypothetical protein